VSSLRAALIIAGNDLRRRFRDRSVVIQGVIAPIALAVLIGLAFGGEPAFEARIAVVDLDRSPVSEAITRDLLDGVGDEVPISFVSEPDAASARDRLDDERVGAAIVVPSGFSASLGSDRPLGLEVLVDPSRTIDGDIAGAVAAGVAARLDAGRLAVATTLETAAVTAPDQIDRIVRDAAAVTIPVEVREEPPGGEWSPIAYFAPSMAMLFLFFTVGAGARSLLTERREGTLTRVRASPLRPGAILAGKAIGVVVLGMVSLLTVWAVTTVVFGANWGDPSGVLAVIVGVVLAIAGISTFVTGLATTDAQADALTSVVAFTLALLGGNFISPGALPDLLATASLATPNGWALRALTDLEAGAASAAEVVPVAVGLAVVGLLTGGVGMVSSARRLAA